MAAQDIRRLARELAAAPRAIAYGRVGICTQEFGALSAWLVYVLNIVTGNLDREGGVMFSTPAADPLLLAATAGLAGSLDRYRSRVSGLPEFSGELPSASLAEEIETPGPGQIRALLVHAGNPVISAPNGARLERALPELELMVSFDLYVTETSRHADYILPPTSPLEVADYDLALSLLTVRNVAHFSPPLFTPPDGSRHDWEVLAGLVSRVLARGGVRERIAGRVFSAAVERLGAEGLLELLLRTGPYGHAARARALLERRALPPGIGPTGLTLGTLRSHPHGLDLGPLVPRLPDRLFTSGKRIRLVHAIYDQELKRLQRMAAPQDGLVLIGRRQLRSNNSWMHNSRRLVKGKPRCTLMMHPDDAAGRALEDGSIAIVSSRVGEVRLPVEVTDTVMRGVVSIPHGWGHDRDGTGWGVARAHAGASANDVTDDQLVDRVSGTAAFNGVPVEVRAEATATIPLAAARAR
jgi:anaerobic selenocysteine-containing dehydrogenase